MVDNSKQANLVGTFIRQRREALGLSQRALGLLFNPPVTTQFISNLERGVTPLPPSHVPTLTKTLLAAEQEFLSLLEKEYALKLSGRLGKPVTESQVSDSILGQLNLQLVVDKNDHEFMRSIYDAYRRADEKTKQAFATVCESMFGITICSKASSQASGTNSADEPQ